jgi:CHAD domain-containing protein
MCKDPTVTGLRKGARRLDRALRHAQTRMARHFSAIERADPVDVHQFRVASRRIRSLLKTFDRHFRRSRADRYRRDLGRAARQFSRLRELDALVALPGMRRAAVALALRAARDAEVTRLQRRLQGTKRWRKVVVDGPTVTQLGLEPDLTLDDVERTIRRHWRRVEKQLAADPTEPETLHSLRISLKNLRYAIEAVEDPRDAPVAETLDRLRTAQALLGAERDLASGCEWLERSALPPSVVRASLRSLQRRMQVLSAQRVTVLRELARAGGRWSGSRGELRRAGTAGRVSP